MRHQYRNIAGIKKTFQQQDWFGPAQFAQAHRIIDFDQRQAIGGGKPAHCPFQSVS